MSNFLCPQCRKHLLSTYEKPLGIMSQGKLVETYHILLQQKEEWISTEKFDRLFKNTKIRMVYISRLRKFLRSFGLEIQTVHRGPLKCFHKLTIKRVNEDIR